MGVQSSQGSNISEGLLLCIELRATGLDWKTIQRGAQELAIQEESADSKSTIHRIRTSPNRPLLVLP